MSRILLIDDDATLCIVIERILRRRLFEVFLASDGASGLRAAEAVRPDVVIVDLRLPDMPGLDVVRSLIISFPTIASIVLTGFGSCASAVEAIRLGASDYLEKPVGRELLLTAVTRACTCHTHDGLGAIPHEPHSVRRWASAVVRAIDSPADVRTLQEWGKAVGVSAGGLRNWCHTAGISPRRSLVFARLLRAVARQSGNTAAQDLLNVVDRRTLSKLLKAGGGRTGLATNVREFLDEQRLIDAPIAIATIRSMVEDVADKAAQQSPVRAT